MYYLLKIQGKAKIPDYVQLRDAQFTLIGYFRLDRPERALEKCGLSQFQDKILLKASEIPFGQVVPLQLHDV